MVEVTRHASWLVMETAEKERQRWIDACFASLCATYRQDRIVLGIELAYECEHSWCQGVVDVLRRTLV